MFNLYVNNTVCCLLVVKGRVEPPTPHYGTARGEFPLLYMTALLSVEIVLSNLL